MQRRARMGVTAALAALAVGLSGCTGGSDGDDGSTDGKSGDGSQSSPAKPGTHASLPEPCGAVSEDTLKDLLVAGAEGETKQPTPEGTAAVTYDIERRVGCQWKSTSTLGSHHLAIDLERVVSYDSTVSDDDRAAELYDAKARKDDIPSEAPEVPEPEESEEPGDDEGADGEDSGDAEDKDEDKDADGEQDGTEPQPETSAGDSEKTPSGSQDPTPPGDESADPSSPSPDPALAPRPLEGIGDVAYLNDELVTADSGLHRDITLVFRAGNVIVTVEYDQWSTDKRLTPGSEELQEKAQKLAKQLVEQLGS